MRNSNLADGVLKKRTRSMITIAFALTILMTASSFLPVLPTKGRESYQAAIPRSPDSPKQASYPMGVSDYGVNGASGYYYEATKFVSWANFTTLSIGESSSGVEGEMTVQQNLVDHNVYENGVAGVYWTQDVPYILSPPNGGRYYTILMLDNIWNMSAPSAKLTGALNFGLTSDCEAGSGVQSSGYYYCFGNQEFLTTLPFELKMTTTTFTMANGAYAGSSAVKFQIAVYHKNRLVGAITFDEVAFIGSDSGNAPYYLVDGFEFNPFGTYNDAETVLCGPGGGSTVPLNSIAATISEAYSNATVSLTLVPHALSYGYDTAETVSGVVMSKTSGSDTGTAASGTDNQVQLW